VVGLWSVHDGALEDRAVDAMTRRLHAFEAWYCELMEHAETQGFRSSHRVSVCGNLVGRSVRPSRLVDLLSNWGGALCFWTWRPSAAEGVEFRPFYGKAPALAAGRSRLKSLLNHLTWADLADAEEEAAHAVRGSKRA
jgi:hypothetical protein